MSIRGRKLRDSNLDFVAPDLDSVVPALDFVAKYLDFVAGIRKSFIVLAALYRSDPAKTPRPDDSVKSS
jgi:hypothetical protein